MYKECQYLAKLMQPDSDHTIQLCATNTMSLHKAMDSRIYLSVCTVNVQTHHFGVVNDCKNKSTERTMKADLACVKYVPWGLRG